MKTIGKGTAFKVAEELPIRSVTWKSGAFGAA
jgi:hypothetical protein